MPNSRPARTGKTSSLDLPPVPSFGKTIGPSFILLGLALGSGELIMWPYLTATWGLGLIWGGLLGISLQYILNTETMRYSLARGESVFVGFSKLSKFWPAWYIFSTFIPWSIPGFSAASSQIWASVFGLESHRWLAIFILLFIGTLLTVGKTLYKTMELFQRSIISIGLPIILALTFYFSGKQDWQELAYGLIGKGEGWWFFPPGIAIASFLGAFAYSGAGGNLNLAQSYYIKEKGFGMGHYFAKVTSFLHSSSKAVELEGKLFRDTTKNRELWGKWWRLVSLEHFLVFWGLGLITIIILAVLSHALLQGGADQAGIQFLFQEANVIGQRTFSFLGTFFLIMSGVMLFGTQVGVLESSARIVSENILLLFHKPGRKFHTSLAFYAILWGQILLGVGILLAGIKEPRFLLTLGALLNGAAMMVSFPLLLFLNKRHLPSYAQPGILRQGLTLVGCGFFAFFFSLLVRDLL